MNNKRLLKIATLFNNDTVVDIGSDHALLPIYLLKNKIIKNAYVIEVNKGPMENAVNNLEKNNLTENAKVILSDGLRSVDKFKEDNVGIVIAGMGGNLIRDIIKNDIYKFKGNTLYLQPNNNEENLRVFLNENNFKIQKERIVKDDKIIYSILVISPDEEKQVLSNEEIIFGLPIEEIELFKEKWNEELNHLISINENFSDSMSVIS